MRGALPLHLAAENEHAGQPPPPPPPSLLSKSPRTLQVSLIRRRRVTGSAPSSTSSFQGLGRPNQGQLAPGLLAGLGLMVQGLGRPNQGEPPALIPLLKDLRRLPPAHRNRPVLIPARLPCMNTSSASEPPHPRESFLERVPRQRNLLHNRFTITTMVVFFNLIPSPLRTSTWVSPRPLLLRRLLYHSAGSKSPEEERVGAHPQKWCSYMVAALVSTQVCFCEQGAP
jgi:hypothetical protein